MGKFPVGLIYFDQFISSFIEDRPWGYKLFFSSEHEILIAHYNKDAEK